LEDSNELQGSGLVVPRDLVQKAYKFGGDRIIFTEDELKQIRTFGEPVLRILGFKPISKLRFRDNLRNSYFIYPSDATVTGSTRTFASLHKKLLKDELMGLAWLIPRRNQAPVFAAIIPQEEEVDDKDTQTTPPGMHCIFLPTVDDIRANPVENTIRGSCIAQGMKLTNVASDELVNKMGEVVNSVKLKAFDPAKYPNPSLQWHYRILQAFALDEGRPDEPVDKTIPNYEFIHKGVGPLALEWGELLNSEVPAGRAVGAPSRKRRAIEDGGEKQNGAAADKIKREKKEVIPASTEKVESLYEQGNLMNVCQTS
jgi:ATP-dependent DNA helicase 2 subunit 1